MGSRLEKIRIEVHVEANAESALEFRFFESHLPSAARRQVPFLVISGKSTEIEERGLLYSVATAITERTLVDESRLIAGSCEEKGEIGVSLNEGNRQFQETLAHLARILREEIQRPMDRSASTTIPRDDQRNLEFLLLCLEGRYTSRSRTLRTLFREAILLTDLDLSVQEFERCILSIVSNSDRTFKAGVSASLRYEVQNWLSSRGAVREIRGLRGSVPWIIRHDLTRAVLWIAGLALLIVMRSSIPDSSRMRTAIDGSALLIVAAAFVFVVLSLPFVRRPCQWLRPFSSRRLASLLVIPVVLAAMEMVEYGIAISETTVLAFVVVSVLATFFAWRELAKRMLSDHAPELAGKELINVRGRHQFALDLEESVVLAIVLDVAIWALAQNSSALQNLEAHEKYFHFLGVKIQREIVLLDTITLHPSLLLLWGSIALGSSLGSLFKLPSKLLGRSNKTAGSDVEN